MLTGRGMRLAVLAVDPSSTRSGGSILGDKTRMERLARDAARLHPPVPEPGGARRRRPAHPRGDPAGRGLGADMVLVETVGVGQSETMVAEMTDVFVLLIAPGGGDELQGVKRGIMEMADLILVNKADGALEAAATRTRADYAGALRLIRPRPGDPEGWPKALTVSALTGAGLAAAWAAVEALAAARRRERRLGGAAAGAGRGLVPPRARGGADRAAQGRPGAPRPAPALAARGRGGRARARGGGRDAARRASARASGRRDGTLLQERPARRVRQLALGYTATGGPDIGVIEAVGAAVGDGDDGAFYAAWMATGDRFVAEAEAPRRRTATSALPAAVLGARLLRDLLPPALRRAGRPAARRLLPHADRRLRPGLALLPHPVEPLRIPFEGTTLPGYFLPATGTRTSVRPLVILTNGYDATVTEMYFACAVPAAAPRLPLPLLRRPGPGRDADRAGHADPARLGGRDPPGRRLRADAARRRSRPHRALGLEPRRLPGAARRQRRAAARRLHRRPRPPRGDDAGALVAPRARRDRRGDAGHARRGGARAAARGEPADALGTGPARPLGASA